MTITAAETNGDLALLDHARAGDASVRIDLLAYVDPLSALGLSPGPLQIVAGDGGPLPRGDRAWSRVISGDSLGAWTVEEELPAPLEGTRVERRSPCGTLSIASFVELPADVAVVQAILRATPDEVVLAAGADHHAPARLFTLRDGRLEGSDRALPFGQIHAWAAAGDRALASATRAGAVEDLWWVDSDGTVAPWMPGQAGRGARVALSVSGEALFAVTADRLERWDGAAWATVHRATGPTNHARQSAVRAVSPDEAWFVLQTGPTVARYRNGEVESVATEIDADIGRVGGGATSGELLGVLGLDDRGGPLLGTTRGRVLGLEGDRLVVLDSLSSNSPATFAAFDGGFVASVIGEAPYLVEHHRRWGFCPTTPLPAINAYHAAQLGPDRWLVTGARNGPTTAGVRVYFLSWERPS